MTTHDIRQKYLDFFANKGHTVIPSALLLPENDTTTLFTGSGMQPMVPFLLGQKHPLGTKITDSQKCFRSQDMDEVGDNRHTTFFEMLGNWSLGDYFKREQIPWIFEFVTKELGLDSSRLFVTCFRGKEDIGIPKDEEAAALWKEQFERLGIDAPIVDFPEEHGMQGGRIFYYPAEKNWWSRAGIPEKMPLGEPGGPDTEMFWDFSEELGLHEKSEWKDQLCHVNCDCGRFMEIGNNVFMEYVKTQKGFEPLPQKNVDFGGGLERLAAAVNDDNDVFMIDIFTPMRQTLERVSGKTYGHSGDMDKAFRVIMDHLRAATFLIADGAVPSNKDQGYFIRRLMRRAVRFAQILGIQETFCPEIAASVITAYEIAYPELAKKKEYILLEMQNEEKKFKRTLQEGMKKFEEIIEGQDGVISATSAFDLYQSFGFPIEMTIELAQEKGLSVDVEGFLAELKKHQELSRSGSQQKFKGGLSDHSEMSVKYHTATHLLHVTLKRVLGDHVEQKGSNITPDRLRFDFSHPVKMTDEQIKETEDLINAAITRDYPVSWQETTVKDAYDQKVIGLFPERYDEQVKVYTVGNPTGVARANPDDPTYSREICGGPHVEHTGVLGHFKIVKEEALGAGVRRIKAILE